MSHALSSVSGIDAKGLKAACAEPPEKTKTMTATPLIKRAPTIFLEQINVNALITNQQPLLKDVFYLLWGGLTVNTFFAAGLWLVSSGWGLVVEEKAIALSDITGIILVFILGISIHFRCCASNQDITSQN